MADSDQISTLAVYGSSSASADNSASSEQTFDSKVISMVSASQYQKELETWIKRNQKPLTSAEAAFRLKALKVYGQTLTPTWRRRFDERMTNIEAQMA